MRVVLGVGVWYVIQTRSQDTGPTNLPTADERERMREIEESSSQIAPNAKKGVGVVPPGTMPPIPVSSTTVATGTPTSTTPTEE